MLKQAACCILIGLSCICAVDTIRADTINIGFDQIDQIAASQSPRGKIIGLQFDLSQAERDESLKWTNPELGYDREDLESSDEYQVTLGKRFEMPWVYLKRHSAWQDRIRSSEFLGEARRKENVAELKSGYVAAKLHEQYLDRLQQLRGILTDASSVAETRRTEGHLSGVEEHLVQMVVISLNASYQEALQRQREASTSWRAAMGYSADDSLILTTDVDYLHIEIRAPEYYSALSDSHPAVEAREAMRSALSKQASASRASFIPSISLYGGYKSIAPDNDGYVAGLSIGVPIFNLNGAEARRYEAESRIAHYEAILQRSRLKGKAEALALSIAESQNMLSRVADHFEEDLEALNSLLYSYEEGWLTLNELLNAIQIETGGLEDYYGQLIRYYENLFELEALTGETLVNF